MTSKSSSPSSADGFSLLELLIAASLMFVVGGASLVIVTSGRNLYNVDRQRTGLNQNLKAARDFLGLDVRQAGELFPANFPALEIVRGEDLSGGATGDPDRLVLRRNLVSTVMRSCRDLSGTTREIYIAELVEATVPPGCVPVPDGDGDGWPDNHRVWNLHRTANGKVLGNTRYVWAYIYDPVTHNGELFRYWRDRKDDGYILTTLNQSWQHSYPEANQARVYILEERRYQLVGDTFQIVVNGVDADAVNIAADLVDFQLLAHFEGMSPTDVLVPGDDWTDLRGIEVALEGNAVHEGVTLERRITTTLTPRNVMSR